MSKFILVTFPDETKAYEGTRCLEELHAEGSLTLYGLAVVARGSDGKLSVKKESEFGPLGLAVGSIAGGMIGLLGGPIGAVIGLSGGALLGLLSDMSNLGVSGEFLDKVAHDLTPGRVAVVAEVAEDWVTPLNTRMAALGGVVHRTARAGVEDEITQKQMAAMKIELSQLESEYDHSRAETRDKLKARIEEVEAKAKGASERLQHRLAALKQETEAKLKSLQAQAVKSAGHAKTEIVARIAELRLDDERRASQLKQAWNLTKKALA